MYCFVHQNPPISIYPSVHICWISSLPAILSNTIEYPPITIYCIADILIFSMYPRLKVCECTSFFLVQHLYHFIITIKMDQSSFTHCFTYTGSLHLPTPTIEYPPITIYHFTHIIIFVIYPQWKVCACTLLIFVYHMYTKILTLLFFLPLTLSQS